MSQAQRRASVSRVGMCGVPVVARIVPVHGGHEAIDGGPDPVIAGLLS